MSGTRLPWFRKEVSSSSKRFFEIQKGQLSGQSKGNEGEQRFDRIAFDEGSLTYRTYQDERIVDVRAHMAKDGKLEGEWSIADGSGKTVASGEWRAERQR